MSFMLKRINNHYFSKISRRESRYLPQSHLGWSPPPTRATNFKTITISAAGIMRLRNALLHVAVYIPIYSEHQSPGSYSRYLKMKAAGSSETVLTSYRFTWQNNPENQNVYFIRTLLYNRPERRCNSVHTKYNTIFIRDRICTQPLHDSIHSDTYCWGMRTTGLHLPTNVTDVLFQFRTSTTRRARPWPQYHRCRVPLTPVNVIIILRALLTDDLSVWPTWGNSDTNIWTWSSAWTLQTRYNAYYSQDKRHKTGCLRFALFISCRLNTGNP
jgi:hypothetical protein